MAVLYFRNEKGEFVEVPVIVGRSAYQIALDNGFVGTEKEWLATIKGEPGYTPVKGVDYNDGYTPVKGVDYNDGKDGVTPVKGVDYTDGKDGHTPVKGTDYWTDADKDEIKEYVADEVIGSEVVSVTSGRDLTKEDAGKFLCVDGASLGVPSGIFDIGIEIEIFRNGADSVGVYSLGGVSFAIPGHTALEGSRTLYISEQYSSIVLKQIATNVWSVQGAVE